MTDAAPSSDFARPGRHTVAVVVRPGVKPLELGAVHQLFGEARSFRDGYSDQTSPGRERNGGYPLYQVLSCTAEPGAVPTSADYSIGVANDLSAVARADTVLVPAAWDDDDTRVPSLTAELASAIAAIPPGARVASICTGAFVLAEAGLLDGRRATTHWMSCARFRRQFPEVLLDPNVLYTEDGTVLTSAGEAAGIDLCLHMIRSDFGIGVSNDLARRTVVPPHRDGGQAQYIRLPIPEPGRSATGNARSWALTQLHRSLSLRELAARERMSTRTFTRRFHAEVGTTPLRWLTQQRIERACQLLESSDHPIDRIASEVGLGTGASLRQHFQTALGTSPSAYRNTFRG